MDEWTVLNNLREILQLDEQGAADALPLCRSALKQIHARLRDGADFRDFRIIRAAAGIAYHNFTLRRTTNDDGITSFKAGDVTVSRSYTDATAQSERVRDERLRDVLPLLKDENFLFCSI